MTAQSLRAATTLAMVLAALGAPSAHAISNQEFASQVRELRGQMLRDEQVVGEAAMLCAYLPPHRLVDEPQCIALHGHFRAAAQEQSLSWRSRLGLVLEFAAKWL